jgi:hypothetical protein
VLFRLGDVGLNENFGISFLGGSEEPVLPDNFPWERGGTSPFATRQRE